MFSPATPPPEPPALVAEAPAAPATPDLVAAQTSTGQPNAVPRGPSISAAMTETDIEVDARYSGTEIVLYGAVFNPGPDPIDVILVVRGPEEPVRLVRKIRAAGLWLNSRPVLFEGAPGFYQAASTRPLNEIAPFGALRRLGIGLDHIRINAPEEQRWVNLFGVSDVVISRLGEDYLDWRRAVIRLHEAEGLYAADPEGVRFVDPGLFRAEIVLPPEAPTGLYETEVWMFQNGRAISVRRGEITVRKVGLERFIYTFAHRMPWLYGVLSVLIALITGWGASTYFRRT